MLDMVDAFIMLTLIMLSIYSTHALQLQFYFLSIYLSRDLSKFYNLWKWLKTFPSILQRLGYVHSRWCLQSSLVLEIFKTEKVPQFFAQQPESKLYDFLFFSNVIS